MGKSKKVLELARDLDTPDIVSKIDDALKNNERERRELQTLWNVAQGRHGSPKFNIPILDD